MQQTETELTMKTNRNTTVSNLTHQFPKTLGRLNALMAASLWLEFSPLALVQAAPADQAADRAHPPKHTRPELVEIIPQEALEAGPVPTAVGWPGEYRL
jgi:hypothetical protein